MDFLESDYEDDIDDTTYDAPKPLHVTGHDVAMGKDIQGIDWSSLPVTRENFRDSRMANYQNFRNCDREDGEIRDLAQNVTLVDQSREFFKFRYTKMRDKCSIDHFQLRNLLWPTSKNDVFYTYDTTVRHWCPLARTSTTALQLREHEMGFVKISTMAAKHGVLLVGGFGGEYIYRNIFQPSDPFYHYDSPSSDSLTKSITSTNRTTSTNKNQAAPAIQKGAFTKCENGITNHLDIAQARSGTLSAIVSSNDNRARIMDLASAKITHEFAFNFAVNCTALSPDKRLLVIAGDQKESLLVDAESGEKISSLLGHFDYSFACAWSPTGHIIATGNQDMTCRLYDTRNMSKAYCVLKGNIGAIRSIRFSDDGTLLGMAEAADFVHVFDMTAPFVPKAETPYSGGSEGYPSQVLDFFGEIAGFGFTPGEAEGLFVGNADMTYGSILEFERKRSNVFSSLSSMCI
ncbi:WD40-repeat-containing domain protein [Cladochytrium replicatum]|nr:WD40-repeat-containing domain protein [Cladochytrium replicatum]